MYSQIHSIATQVQPFVNDILLLLIDMKLQDTAYNQPFGRHCAKSRHDLQGKGHILWRRCDALLMAWETYHVTTITRPHGFLRRLSCCVCPFCATLRTQLAVECRIGGIHEVLVLPLSSSKDLLQYRTMFLFLILLTARWLEDWHRTLSFHRSAHSLLKALPMTILLTSLVPAPISYSFASLNILPAATSFM